MKRWNSFNVQKISVKSQWYYSAFKLLFKLYMNLDIQNR
jgi:hypothetical protein